MSYGVLRRSFAFPLSLCIATGFLLGALGASASSPPDHDLEPDGRIADPARALDASRQAEVIAAGNNWQAFEDRTGIRLNAVVVRALAGVSTAEYAARRLADAPRGGVEGSVILVVDAETKSAAIAATPKQDASLGASVRTAIIEKRVLPHLRVGDVTGGVLAGGEEIRYTIEHGPAELFASAPDRISWFEAHRDALYRDFLLGLVALFTLALAIAILERCGWLPRKRTGLWRVLDAITRIATSIKVSASRSSSTGSSSGKFGGGGGTSAGGGASGKW